MINENKEQRQEEEKRIFNPLPLDEALKLFEVIRDKYGLMLPIGVYIPSSRIDDFIKEYARLRKTFNVKEIVYELKYVHLSKEPLFYDETKKPKKTIDGIEYPLIRSFWKFTGIRNDDTTRVENLLSMYLTSLIKFQYLKNFFDTYRRPDIIKFINCMQRLFPNVAPQYVYKNIYTLAEFIENKMAKINVKGAELSSNNLMLILLSEKRGGTGKSFILNLFRRFEEYLNLICYNNLPSLSFTSPKLAYSWGGFIREYQPLAIDETREKMLFNDVLDGGNILVEMKYQNPVEATCHISYMAGSNYTIKSSNTRRFGYIVYNSLEVTPAVFQQYRRFLEIKEEETFRLIMSLYLSCPFKSEQRYLDINNENNDLYTNYEFKEEFKDFCQYIIDHESFPNVSMTGPILKKYLINSGKFTLDGKRIYAGLQDLIQEGRFNHTLKYDSEKNKTGNPFYCSYFVEDLYQVVLDSEKKVEQIMPDDVLEIKKDGRTYRETPLNTYEAYEYMKEYYSNTLTEWACAWDYTDEDIDKMVENLHNQNILFKDYEDCNGDKNLPPSGDDSDELGGVDFNLSGLTQQLEEETHLPVVDVNIDTDFNSKQGMFEIKSTFTNHNPIMIINKDEAIPEYLCKATFKKEYMQKVLLDNKEWELSGRRGVQPWFENKKENKLPKLLVYESDTLPLETQKKIAKDLIEGEYRNYIFGVVYSGNKSIHISLRLTKIVSEEQYHILWHYWGKLLFGDYYNSLDFYVGKNWSGNTRCPGAVNSKTGNIQVCYHWNPDCLSANLSKDFNLNDDKKNKIGLVLKSEYTYNKEFTDTIEKQLERVVDKSLKASAQDALTIYKYGRCGDIKGGALTSAVGYACTLGKKYPKFQEFADTVYKIANEEHHTNIHGGKERYEKK